MKKLILALVASAGLLAVAQSATAGGNANPFNGPPSTRLIFPLFHKQSLPAFQAAPWYLYWPYNGHFQTPAPIHGAFYGPPGMGGAYGGGGMANPYFQQVPPQYPGK
jgi:hypothetical protein